MRCTLRLAIGLAAAFACAALPRHNLAVADDAADQVTPESLSVEEVSGEGIWIQPLNSPRLRRVGTLRAKVWFDRQFLGDGTSYLKRAKEFSNHRRRQLRRSVVRTLKEISDQSYAAARDRLTELVDNKTIRDVERHWIVNGFSCTMDVDAVDQLKTVPGVRKIFLTGQVGRFSQMAGGAPPAFTAIERPEFNPDRYKHPWYARYLLADRVWKEFGVTGSGTLNVIHDFNFVFSDNTTRNLFRNPGELAGNEKDDDGNGLVDDYHGFNFDQKTAVLTTRTVQPGQFQPQQMHGFMCSAIVCGVGVEGKEFEFGLAPEASWAGVIGAQRLEAAVQWAIEQEADTYSMSFSIPGLGDYRSHWRKIMEHGSFCGVFFVSGAGNFAQQVPTPVQMRVPEDIPEVVFAAAGVQRNFLRTPFSSKGPVEWQTEHYRDGEISKPEVCAFNMGLPVLLTDGTVRPTGLNGNSFAGPMFAGSIALMLSADPDLLPWDLKQIVTETAMDVAAPGVDDETGHGLINCYRAVRETLRRRAIREGEDPQRFAGGSSGDELDVNEIQAMLKSTTVRVARVQPNSQASRVGLKPGDKLISCGGQPISKRQDLIAARQQNPATDEKPISLVIMRDGETLEFDMGPGPFGFVPVVEFDDPVFK